MRDTTAQQPISTPSQHHRNTAPSPAASSLVPRTWIAPARSPVTVSQVRRRLLVSDSAGASPTAPTCGGQHLQHPRRSPDEPAARRPFSNRARKLASLLIPSLPIYFTAVQPTLLRAQAHACQSSTVHHPVAELTTQLSMRAHGECATNASGDFASRRQTATSSPAARPRRLAQTLGHQTSKPSSVVELASRRHSVRPSRRWSAIRYHGQLAAYPGPLDRSILTPAMMQHLSGQHSRKTMKLTNGASADGSSFARCSPSSLAEPAGGVVSGAALTSRQRNDPAEDTWTSKRRLS
jgi:hypothetical protein